VSCLFRLTTCSPTKPNIRFSNSMATTCNYLELYRFLTFQDPNFKCIFISLGVANLSVQVRYSEVYVAKCQVYKMRNCWHLAQNQTWSSTLDLCPRLTIQQIAVTLRIWRPYPPSTTWGQACGVTANHLSLFSIARPNFNFEVKFRKSSVKQQVTWRPYRSTLNFILNGFEY
jgi:hypothetical protein